MWWGHSLPTSRKGVGLILPSAFAASFWRRRFPKVSETATPEMVVINPGIVVPSEETKRDQRSSRSRHEAGAGTEAVAPRVVNIGWLGRMESQKAPGLMIRLVKSLKVLYDGRDSLHVCCVMLGGGTLLGTGGGDRGGTSVLLEMAEHYGLNIGRCVENRAGEGGTRRPKNEMPDLEFMGALGHSDVLKELRRVDLVVHTNVLEETFATEDQD